MAGKTRNPRFGKTFRRSRVRASSHVADSASNLSTQEAKRQLLDRQEFQSLLAFAALHEQVLRRAERPVVSQSGAFAIDRKEQFSLGDKLQLIAERGMAVTGADGIAIAVAEKGVIATRAHAGIVRPDMEERIDGKSGFSGTCLRIGKIVLCNDSETDAIVNRQRCRQLGARSMIAVPLYGGRGVIGLLEAFSKQASRLDDEDVQNLSRLSELLSAALTPEDEDRFANSAQVIAIQLGFLPGSKADLLENAAKSTPIVLDAGVAQKSRFRVAASFCDGPDRKTAERAIEEGLTANIRAQPIEANGTFRSNIFVAIAISTVVIAFTTGHWSKMRNSQVSDARTFKTKLVKPADSTSFSRPAPGAVNSATAKSEVPSQPLRVASSGSRMRQLATFPKVTGIHYWSDSASTTVVFDLEDQVAYDAHRLARPDRIFFDLNATELTSGLSGKSIRVGNELLKRIRVGQPVSGVTRVVFDTKLELNFSVQQKLSPYRIMVELRKASN